MADTKEIAEIIESYGTDFLDWFLSVLFKPLTTGGELYPAKRRFVFLTFCTLIGATIGSLIPGRPPIGDRATVAVTVIALWTFTSVLIHVTCRILRGHGSLNNTILSMLQILAVAYVVSNFVVMLTTSAASLYSPIKAALASVNLSKPGDQILFLQFVILAVYTPFVLTSVHRFQGLLLGSIAGVLAAGIAVLLATPVALSGHC